MVTSAPVELVRRTQRGAAIERALACAELTPEQLLQLFGAPPRAPRARADTLARVGRRMRELDVLSFLRAHAPFVDERSLAYWLQGAPKHASIPARRAEFFRRFLAGPARRAGL